MATRTIYWVNCEKVERDTDDATVLWVTYWDNKVFRLNHIEFRTLVSVGSFDVEVAVDNRHLVVENIYRLHGGEEVEPF